MRDFLAFLKSRLGLASLAVAVLVVIVYSWATSRKASGPAPLPGAAAASTLSVSDLKPGSIPAPRPPGLRGTNGARSRDYLSIDAHLESDTNAVPTLFLPAGGRLQCVLVDALESIRIDTPVTGLVITDAWFNGQLVVPRGTRVLGKAKVDRVRDRLAAEGTWTLVFPNGEELLVTGMVLHADVSPDGTRHGPDDGSAGFKGQVIHQAGWDEIKMFASTFLSGMSRGLQRSDYTIYGAQLRQTLPNSALNGSAAVLDEYAKSIAETIKRDGVYVHVGAGSLFYLHLPQTLNRSAARIAATLLTH
jgi:hypothetical protein